MSKIRIAGIEPYSVVDGPGIRYTIYMQGCLHNCKGCHNPQTHDSKGGYEISLEELLEDIANKEDHLTGFTLSGGDPFEPYINIHKTKEICKELKERYKDKSIWIYTGYTFEQLKHIDWIKEYVDVIVDGKFEIDKKSPDIVFRGSNNQRIIDVKKSLENNSVVDISSDFDSRKEISIWLLQIQ